MAKTRILVTGKYETKDTYILTKEDGTVFQVIKEGEPFKIENQMRPWIPVRVPKRNGKGTMMVCRKFNDRNQVIKEFPLVHNKRGLWALTSGAARNGVFHNYQDPANDLEKLLDDLGVSRRVIEKVEKISEIDLEVYGIWRDCRRDCWYECETDGKVETEEFEDPISETRMAHVSGGTYLVQTERRFNNNVQVKQLLITANADEKAVIKAVKSCFGIYEY